MLQQFQNHLNQNFPFLKEKKLLLAVSGGLDSMVLADLFFKSNLKFSVAHCNFQLRKKESDEDEWFVKDFCQSHDIEGFYQKFDTQKFAEDTKLSIQLAARKLRYDWFNELLKKEGFDFVLTAHHLDDDIETFLINFVRGTGLEGLTGIPQQHEKVLRPLLIFARSEIENYAQENKVSWREDRSNVSDKYMRNKIRQQVVPILKDLNPGFLQSFQNTQKHLKQSQSLVEDA
ncbi:MAG TPA: tRNA lysidine(34) synthetase TilS, partial [Flavobacterium sp.]|nr:tRNA lysidine(34) synthetase TilS [Flavobacterium sp.]